MFCVFIQEHELRIGSATSHVLCQYFISHVLHFYFSGHLLCFTSLHTATSPLQSILYEQHSHQRGGSWCVPLQGTGMDISTRAFDSLVRQSDKLMPGRVAVAVLWPRPCMKEILSPGRSGCVELGEYEKATRTTNPTSQPNPTHHTHTHGPAYEVTPHSDFFRSFVPGCFFS